MPQQLSPNRPFPRYRKPLFKNEAKCKTFLVKKIFYYYANKTHFHKRGFSLVFVLRVRVFGTREWFIAVDSLIEKKNVNMGKKENRRLISA